jgi:hypothetical protein
MCMFTYTYMFIHTSVFVYVWIYGSTYIYMYWGMCTHIFITIHVCNDTRIQIHTDKQNVFMLWHITTFGGRAKRLGCTFFANSAFEASQLWMTLSVALNILHSILWHLTLATEPIASFHPTGSPSERSAWPGYRKPHAPWSTRHTHSTQSNTQTKTLIFPTEYLLTSPTQEWSWLSNQNS